MIPEPVPLILKPTPCHRLERASRDLGIDLWIKRDDLTGFAFGGNKGRKLEYLMAQALLDGAESIATCGSAQSNFVRQLGAACAIHGLKCHAAVMELPYAAVHGKPQHKGSRENGNVLLDQLLGVRLHFFPDDDWEVLYAHAETIAKELEGSGERVYRIPIGGSSPLGAFAFARAAEEVDQEFDWLVTACSSGSTHAGLAYGFHGTATRVIGVACDPEPEIMEDLVRLVQGLDELTGLSKNMGEADLDFRLDWAGDAYGVPSQAGDEAIEYLAKREGVFLDPVYSGKSFAGLLDMARSGAIGGRVLFWHTGGTPALFAD